MRLQQMVSLQQATISMLVLADFNSRDSVAVAKQLAKYNTMREEEHSLLPDSGHRIYDRTRPVFA